MAAGLVAFWLPETITCKSNATDRGTSRGMERGLQDLRCKKPKIHASKVKEIAMEANALKEKEEEDEIMV